MKSLIIQNIPKINSNLITQEQFNNAVEVIAKSYCESQSSGLKRGFFTPGANGEHYGNGWWSLDYSLIVDGAKWFDFGVAVDFIYNMIDAQMPNGRVKLYFSDDLRHIPNVQEEASSIPKYFETAFDVAVMSGDKKIIEDVYGFFKRSLEWWTLKRQDKTTKLFSALFEETFIPNTESKSMVYAPIDTNAQLYVGLKNTSALAKMLGKEKESLFYQERANEVYLAVNEYMWNEEDGCYYPYVLTQKRQQKTLMASTFVGFYFADEHKKRKLTTLMTDDSYFNWNSLPLTTVSKKDPIFTVVNGPYQGNPSWSGSVWTLTNMAAIKALRSAGLNDLAYQLAVKTVLCFRDNYSEFIDPFKGTGEGVHYYGWTASQFVQVIIEVLFGDVSLDEKQFKKQDKILEFKDYYVEVCGLKNTF